MLVFMIKSILFLFGLLLVGAYVEADYSVIAFLIAVTVTSLNQYFNQRFFTLINVVIYCSISFFSPTFSAFLPLIAFDLLQQHQKYYLILSVLPLMTNVVEGETYFFLLVMLLLGLTTLLQHMVNMIENLSQTYNMIQDENREQELSLRQKNKELMEKQGNEIHLATLEERNRIARDMHDHVGHALSRAILQTGALQTLNKDEKLVEFLTSLQETLTFSMDSIRRSVHDLKDDSIDLYEAIKKIFASAPYEIHVHYDIDSVVSHPIKYCFLTVAKEALTNATKHSNATQMNVTIQEHPAIFQLLITDNGTRKPNDVDKGMGLQNITERVQSLEGHCSFSYEEGFRIFISIPKQIEVKE